MLTVCHNAEYCLRSDKEVSLVYWWKNVKYQLKTMQSATGLQCKKKHLNRFIHKLSRLFWPTCIIFQMKSFFLSLISP